MLHCAGGWLTGRSMADEGDEVTLIIPQLLSGSHMEIKPKEENYLAAVSVSMLLYPRQNCSDH